MRLLMMRRCALIAAACLVACGGASDACHAAQYLFNGVDLTGWTKLGGAATYTVNKGELVGTSAAVGSPNTFLVTTANYGDFALSLNFKIDAPAFNSGVQLRSQSLPSHNSGRVFGYQAEIDPSTRSWTGGLYFEGGSPTRGAGYLDDLSDNAAARAAFQLGQWNHFLIVCNNRRIQIWLNDVLATDYTDNHATALLPSGFIGLQVHSVTPIAPGPFQVRWRDIQLSSLTDLAVIVDPTTGRGRLENASLLDATIEGYTIFSATSSLRPANGAWRSLADQGVPGWTEASPTAGQLSELNTFGSLTIGGGDAFDLGTLFKVVGGTRDLRFEYLSPGIEQAQVGSVIYRLGGDFDADGDVDHDDLTSPVAGWRKRFGVDLSGADFLTWQRQLGMTLTTAAGVPEPAGAALALISVAALATVRGCGAAGRTLRSTRRC
jgi:hypothetical protein